MSDFVLKQYLKAFEILAQVGSPNIIIEPQEPVLQKAVELLKSMDPNYFKDVEKIVVSHRGSEFGYVESGKDKNPAIVNIDINKIKSSNSEDAVISAATVIAHEVGHVRSFKEGQFVGGENPAQQEENKVAQWIKSNMNNLAGIL